MAKLKRGFYQRKDVVLIAKELLGKHFYVQSLEGLTVGKITEVEAYAGRNDQASHARDGLRTARNEIMYEKGGMTYVYLIYGIHHLFNVVTNIEGFADAVLIRGIEPLDGVDLMMKRRAKSKLDKTLTSGPGTLSQAFGINYKRHNDLDLLGNEIWIEDQPILKEDQIVTSTRIGVDYAGEDALKPWRFYIMDNKWVSKK